MKKLKSFLKSFLYLVLGLFWALGFGLAVLFFIVHPFSANRAYRELGEKLSIPDIPNGTEGRLYVADYILCEMLVLGSSSEQVGRVVENIGADLTEKIELKNRYGLRLRFSDFGMSLTELASVYLVIIDGKLQEKSYVYASDTVSVNCEED